MNNEIQPFEFEGNKVRALADGDEVMFVASDIAKILGYRDAEKLTRTLDDEEKGTRPIGTHGGTQTMTVISEPGLYKAILQRQTGRMEVEVTREFVKRFQRWVTHEVLPQIRKTGGYIPTTDADDDMTILAKAVMIGQRTMEAQKRKIAAQQTRIDELQPKASMWDNFVDIPDVLSVGNSAKLLSNLGRPIGRKTLFSWLERNGWVFRENGHWIARQNRIDAGHLVMVPPKSHGTHRDGTTFSFAPTVKITRKGLGLIARRMSEATLQLEYTKAGA